MAKYIKNNSGATDTWSGQELTNGQIYQLKFEDNLRFIVDSREVGGKIETDVASGDLKVSVDNFATILSVTDAIDLLRAENAGCIQDVYVDDSGKQDGYALKYDSASDKIIYGPASVGGGANVPAISIKRSTSFAIPITPTAISFDVEEVENEPTILEHHNTNTARIYLHEVSLYHGIVNLEVINSSTQDRTFTIELWRNGTQLLSTTAIIIDKSSTEHITRALIIPEVAAGDYVTLRMGASDSGTLTLGTNSRVIMFQMKGATGATGPQGADGDITWQGTWTSQNYTTNQAVYYAPTGQSYVCHTSTTSNQDPTDTGFWDLLAKKGDTGPAGSGQKRIDISIHPHNDDKKNTTSATYISQARFIWGGSTLLGTPTKIYANSRQDASGSGQVRIYDITNGLVIAESASITSTADGNIVDLGTITNLSTGQAVWQIQNKCDGVNVNNISSVSIEF